MELDKIIVGTSNISLQCLVLNDNFLQRTHEEISGPNPIKPLVFEILNLKNNNKAMNHLDFQRMMLSDGKNRMMEQIDDSNLLKDSELNKIRKEDAFLLLNKVKDIISNECIYINKCCQLIYIINSGLLSQYRNFFKLNEYLDNGNVNLKEVSLWNKKLNKIIIEVLSYIDNEMIYKIEALEKNYLENKSVSKEMKEHLKLVGIQWIKESITTNTIYKSFRRKAKMDSKQKAIFSEFVVNVREQSKKSIDLNTIISFFNLSLDDYYNHKDIALKPIDNLLDTYITFE